MSACNAGKPSSNAPKVSKQPSTKPAGPPSLETKENEYAAQSRGVKPRPSQQPRTTSAPALRARPAASSARKAATSAITQSTVSAAPKPPKMAAGARQRAPPAGSSGDKPASSRPAAVKSAQRTGRVPLRPRGLATVGAAQPVFTGDGEQRELHPAVVKSARRSGQLNLSDKALAVVPSKVWHINEIDNDEAKQLTMSMDGDERWWDQVPLIKLLLSGNRLTELSAEVGLLTQLHTLDLHDNALHSLPPAVSQLDQLTRLVVSHNQLQQLPAVTALRQLLADHNQLTELPEQLGDCLDLELLDVSHNQLDSLPTGLGYLHKLNRLNVSDNQLKSLPDEVGSMTWLRHLDLARNRLCSVPSSLGQLTQLEVLDLRQNQLTEIPELTECHALKELHVGFNQIKELSADLVDSLKSLIVLDLSNNKLETLPDEVSSLQRLERLDLRNNDLSVAPLRLCLLPLLKSVQLEGNPLRSLRRDLLTRGTQHLLQHFRERLQGQAELDGVLIPGLGQRSAASDPAPWRTDEQARLHHVHKMKSSRQWCHSNQKAADIPADLIDMAHEAEVATVDLSKNVLVTVPESLLLLSGHLAELSLSTNRLTSLPAELGRCSHLTYVNVSGNQLSSLPDSLAGLKYLREVCLSLNRFASVPSVLYGLPSLEIILASDNQIETIEVERLLGLGRLATLDLSNNSIAHVPAKLGTVTQLRSLSLEGNTFKQPRPTILAQGTASVLQYLRDRIPMSERTQ